MKVQWSKLGGQLGILFCVAGLVFVWAGWNGAASYNEGPRQFPYLISGGIAGLCLVVIGVGLFVVQSQRADRVQLEANLIELRRLLERMADAQPPAGASGVTVVAGPGAYHQPSCHLITDRDGLRTMSLETALANGLAPCRTCNAPTAS